MNIIIVVTDSFRRDHLGCYGSKTVRTPHLDRFAESALLFKNYYPASLPTVPNRHDLFSGRFTFPYSGWEPMPRNETTLAEMLGQAGYTSMLVADTPHALASGMNYHRGFTAWELIRGQEGDPFWTTEKPLPLPCSAGKLRGGARTMSQHLRNASRWRSDEDTFVARTMRRASEWLVENCRRDKFFLYVDTFDPHEPWMAPQSYIDLYDPGYEGERVLYPRYRKADYLSARELQHMRAEYAAEATLVDRWIGHLLDQVESLGLRESTAIFITADHGFLLGEHNYTGKSIIEPDERRSIHCYEALVAAPLLACVPGGPAGKSVAAMCSTPDIAATVLDLCGVKPNPQVQGKSFRDVLEGSASRCRPFIVTAVGFPTQGPGSSPGIATAMLNDGRYTYLYGGTDERPELYDLRDDPEQKKNLIRKDTARARAMHKKFIRWLEEIESPKQHIEARIDPGF